MAAILDDADVEDGVVASQDAALDRLLAQDFAGTLLRFVDAGRARTAARRRPRSPTTSGRMFEQAEQLEEIRQFRPALYRALPCRRTTARASSRRPRPQTASMIVNQWVPAAHRGDAIGDSARACATCCRRWGTTSEIFALTIDDDLRGDIVPFARRGGARAAT